MLALYQRHLVCVFSYSGAWRGSHFRFLVRDSSRDGLLGSVTFCLVWRFSRFLSFPLDPPLYQILRGRFKLTWCEARPTAQHLTSGTYRIEPCSTPNCHVGFKNRSCHAAFDAGPFMIPSLSSRNAIGWTSWEVSVETKSVSGRTIVDIKNNLKEARCTNAYQRLQ